MICPYLLYSKIPRPPQPDNPTQEERYAMAYYALYRTCHAEDFKGILESFLPPEDITKIAKPGQFKGKRVGIIGGGLAGMSTAFELRKLGFEITIFEANDSRLGGRVYTHYFDRDKKYYGELGAMRIPVNHETVWHYINLFRLDTRPFIQTNPNAFIYLHDIRVRNDPFGENVKHEIYPTYDLALWEKKFSWQQLGYHGIEAPILKAPPQVRREIINVLPRYSPQLLSWDGSSTRQMFQENKLSQGAINLLSNLFPIGGELLYHNYADFVQEYFPVNFWFMYEITGGTVNLPLAFFKSFTNDPDPYYPGISSGLLGEVSWKGGCYVKGIYKGVDNCVILNYLNKQSEMVNEKFDYVVCTIPFSVLRSFNIDPLFSSKKMQAIKEVTYANAQKTAFYCKERFWEKQGIIGGGSFTDLPITTLWYPSDHAQKNEGSDKPGAFLASYNFHLDAVRLGNMPEPLRFEKIKRNVEAVHGLPEKALDPIVTDTITQVWDNDPLYRGAFCYFTPEQKKLFSWEMTIPEYNQRVFFAGEHVSALHRWQQGALKSGMEAANALVRSLIQT